ncbi:MAG: DUF3465 domain-containing protein [Gammaproteobacteria bacterium]
MKPFKSKMKSVLTLIVLLVAAIYQHFQGNVPSTKQTDSSTSTTQNSGTLWKANQWITIEGKVSRLLHDDNIGSRHQKFIIRQNDGSTLLVAHNIDLAKRIPLQKGDSIKLRGQYETNDRGGLVHWTHHDPMKSGSAGWIEHQNKRYE